MRRLFIIRKDLHLKPGKLAAMIGHLCEAFWTNAMKAGTIKDNEFETLPAVETYADGRKGPALYKHPAVLELSKKAFEAGETSFQFKPLESRPTVTVSFEIPKDIWAKYVNGIFTKTICEARNLNKLNQAAEAAQGLGLSEGKDFGYIRDCCKTDLVPENPDGTCTVGIWFRPLPDEISHEISRKYPLYRD